MPATLNDAAWPIPRRTARTVLVVDLVESVRLYQLDEEGTVRRWQGFVGEVVTRLLPLHGGRLVKSLGDGLMLEFEAVPAAMNCAIGMHSAIAAANAGRAADTCLWLRAGAHVADVYFDEHDIYGAGVNLAARLMSLAQRGETIVSANIRAGLLPDVDADVEDLGDVDLKGIPEPVRAYRVGRPAAAVALPTSENLSNARATIVVLPIEIPLADDEQAVVGDILADDIIVGLSASPHWNVISRLSAAAFRHRRPTLEQLRDRLHATYVLSGRCLVSGQRLRLTVELADAVAGTVVWAGEVGGALGDLTAPFNPLAGEVIAAVTAAIFEHEIRRARVQPLPTLRSHSLLYGAIGLMHRLSRQDFERAHALLEQLSDRHPGAPEPRVWQAKWHVLGITQGWSADPTRQAGQAHDSVQRALDRQSDHALALAIDGLIAGYLNGDLDTSEQRYRKALELNPNEAFAWLFLSALHAYRDRGEDAVRCAQTAIGLSPLDPVRYFFDSFLANALLAAGRFEESIAVGQRSVRGNCTHMPTYRSLAIAQVLAGQEEAARQTVVRLLQAHPGYSLEQFRIRYAGRQGVHAQRYEMALRSAGLPES
ncbi:MAG: hypothetical protein KF788_04740 [Piscinibacter sp.]|nr:hypothetical protein [Piscinibacter sp.]